MTLRLTKQLTNHATRTHTYTYTHARKLDFHFIRSAIDERDADALAWEEFWVGIQPINQQRCLSVGTLPDAVETQREHN